MKRGAQNWLIFFVALFLLFSSGSEASCISFYRYLAEYWSPDFYQDTWFDPDADYITAFDADGDWVGNNNLENHGAGRFKPYFAYIYYTVLESRTHYFIYYCYFHPVDYERPIIRLLPDSCHENDFEGVLVVAEKAGENRFGRFRVLETMAHGFFNLYSNREGVRAYGGFKPEAASFNLIQVRSLHLGRALKHPRFEPAGLRDGHHPQIYIQGGGHGPYELHSYKSAWTRRNEFKRGTGVIYRYSGKADSPRGPNDRDVGYDLVDIFAPRGLWDHRCNTEDGMPGPVTFDPDFFQYEPPEGRPTIPESVSSPPGTLPYAFDGDLGGMANSEDAANPPWGWGSPKKQIKPPVPRGAWAIDPAWTMLRHWRFDEEYSLEYIYNPYLGIR